MLKKNKTANFELKNDVGAKNQVEKSCGHHGSSMSCKIVNTSRKKKSQIFYCFPISWGYLQCSISITYFRNAIITPEVPTPRAISLPPKTIYTTELTLDTKNKVPPRPKVIPRLKRSPDYYDELHDEGSGIQDVPGLFSVPYMDDDKKEELKPTKVNRMNCIQYVVDI
jgi:hypothetical protein